MKIFPIHDFIKLDSDFFKILKFLPKIEESGPWVAGGSIWKAMENLTLDSDIDLFFKDENQCGEWLKTMRTIPYESHVLSEKINSYNISMSFHVNRNDYNQTVKIQCIYFKYFVDINHLLDSFDFTACQFGFDGTNLYTGETSLEDLKNRQIIFHNVCDNVATGLHLRKYIDRGFVVPDSQLGKLKEITIVLEDKAKKDENNWDASISTMDDDEYPRPIVPQSIGGMDLTAMFANRNPIIVPTVDETPPPSSHLIGGDTITFPVINQTLYGRISNTYADISNTYINPDSATPSFIGSAE